MGEMENRRSAASTIKIGYGQILQLLSTDFSLTLATSAQKYRLRSTVYRLWPFAYPAWISRGGKNNSVH